MLKGRIKMNYTPYSSNKKGNYVFYIIVVVSLVVVAVVAWIGLSNMGEKSVEPNTSKNENNNSVATVST